MDSNYTGEAKEKSKEEKTGNIRKVNFAQKYRKYIVAVSTFAAAAIILIIALNMNSMKNNLYEATAPSDNTECATEAYGEEAESSDEAYEDAAESDVVSGGENAAEVTEASVAESTEASMSETAGDYSAEAAEDDSKRESLNSKKSYGTTLNIDDIGTYQTMSLSEYSELIGIDISPIKESMQLENEIVYVSSKEDESGQDKGDIRLKCDTGNADILISRSNSIVPQGLMNGIPTDIDGREVYIGEYSNDQVYIAYFDINGVSFSLQTVGVEKEEFNTMLEDLVKCIQ